jgi:hypothetical protein
MTGQRRKRHDKTKGKGIRLNIDGYDDRIGIAIWHES